MMYLLYPPLFFLWCITYTVFMTFTWLSEAIMTLKKPEIAGFGYDVTNRFLMEYMYSKGRLGHTYLSKERCTLTNVFVWYRWRMAKLFDRKQRRTYVTRTHKMVREVVACLVILLSTNL